LIALSADPQETARQTVRELNLTYPVLSDSYRNHIRAYDVLHPQEGIARPSVFIVDREGKIRWQFIGMSAGERPAMMTILGQLQALR
jgi:peroxiredoxin